MQWLRTACKVRLAFAMTLAALVPATHTHAATPAMRPSVVELFTSQGCSSCPPADALLGEYAKRDDVIALAFHVDYWDYLGWRDRFALPISAQRQRQYVQTLRLQLAFTPQAIIDGSYSVVGSNRSGLLKRLNEARPGIPVNLSLSREALLIDLPSQATQQRLTVNAVAYTRRASTRIGGGENAGRELIEFNVVRAFTPVADWNGEAAQWRLQIATLPSDADQVAVLVQQPQGTILGAARIALR